MSKQPKFRDIVAEDRIRRGVLSPLERAYLEYMGIPVDTDIIAEVQRAIGRGAPDIDQWRQMGMPTATGVGDERID